MKQPQNVPALGQGVGVPLEEQGRGALQGVKGRHRKQPWRRAGPGRGTGAFHGVTLTTQPLPPAVQRFTVVCNNSKRLIWCLLLVKLFLSALYHVLTHL